MINRILGWVYFWSSSIQPILCRIKYKIKKGVEIKIKCIDVSTSTQLTRFSLVSFSYIFSCILNAKWVPYQLIYSLSDFFHEHSLQRTEQPVTKVNQLLMLSEGTDAGQATAAMLSLHHTMSIAFTWKEVSRDSTPALCQADCIFCLTCSFFSLLAPIKDQDKFMHNDCTHLR